mgnify:CR=1 FL=1
MPIRQDDKDVNNSSATTGEGRQSRQGFAGRVAEDTRIISKLRKDRISKGLATGANNNNHRLLFRTRLTALMVNNYSRLMTYASPEGPCCWRLALKR